MESKKNQTRPIREIIVHCTATREGLDYTVEDIRNWHLAQGFNDIGYHYLIYRDGSIHEGRAINVIGAHCKGHNANSIGVCYVGGIDDKSQPKDTRTPEQKATLVHLLRDLLRKYPGARIYGHRDFSSKACPCFDARAEYTALKAT